MPNRPSPGHIHKDQESETQLRSMLFAFYTKVSINSDKEKKGVTR
jgi:hypothetical protein